MASPIHSSTSFGRSVSINDGEMRLAEILNLGFPATIYLRFDLKYAFSVMKIEYPTGVYLIFLMSEL